MAEWGVLSVRELRECGLSGGELRWRVRSGWLHRIHRQVYAVGHPGITREGRFLAAVKSLGRDAVLSHFAAAALWGFVDWDGRYPEVTVPRQGIGHRDGIRVHCSAVLEPRDVMRHKQIPVTSTARTIVDLAAVGNYTLLRRAVRRGLALGRVSIRQVVATRRRLGPRRGSVNLDRVLTIAAPTRSELEDVVLDLIVDARFVRPEVNQPLLLAGRRVVPDFRWPDQQVVVEADGARWHHNPIARRDDAERQALLEAHGEHVLRITWEEALTRPRETITRINAAGVPK
jgi:very-short-patch-repair endonuclease